MLRIVIADDQMLMREGLEMLIRLEDDLQVVGTAGNGEEAYELVRLHRPDLVLMDIQMPGLSGLDATKRIRRDFPGTLVLVLTTFIQEDYIMEALLHGATGYLLKDMPRDKLIQSIRDAASGQLLLPSTVAATLVQRLSTSAASAGSSAGVRSDLGDLSVRRKSDFTEREWRIIDLMIAGRSNREIADALYMSEGTIKNYISVIYGKVGTNDRTKAVLALKRLRGDSPSDAGHQGG